jgi:hypothetical protein
VSLAARLRMRPVLYPAAILLAYVLNELVAWAVSPYAALRPIIALVIAGLAVPWLIGLATGDRDVAGIVTLVFITFALAGQSMLGVVLTLVLAAAVALALVLRARRPATRAALARTLPIFSRALTAVGAIMLLAVAIRAAQGGVLPVFAHDIVAHAPLRLTPATATAAADAPNVYLLLLDGYPRADKLDSVFGIDDSAFLAGLEERGFTVARHSRSNLASTDLSLGSMLDGSLPAGPEASPDTLRQINAGAALGVMREAGYEVIEVASGFEKVAMREADRYVDTGQPNEFEWNFLLTTGFARLVQVLAPDLMTDLHRARVLGDLDATVAMAVPAAGKPRLVLAHVPAPHAPLVFATSGQPAADWGVWVPYDPYQEYRLLGHQEYTRRLADQIGFLDARTLEAVDAIVAADPEAVVVVFSDHGAGIHDGPLPDRGTDVDLKTANLLAVRSPGRTGIVDDRSTLVNLLPRILRAYTGAGPADVPETVYGRLIDGTFVEFQRPD